MAERGQRSDDSYDVVIIGGGATGLGCAVDAAARGYRTALVEAGALGGGTSSRSTKLFHGGVRYLPQLRIGLVREGLAERAILRKLAPSLVRPLGIIIPARSTVEKLYYAAGLKVYDALAGRQNLETSRMLSAAETFERIPRLRRDGIAGGVRYADAQFDDLAFVGALAATARRLGAHVAEHTRATSLLKTNDRITGVVTPAAILSARVVVNATGPRADVVRRMSDPDAAAMMAPSRGSHIVVPASALGGDDGLLIPRTDDGRVIFALPWKGGTLVGTTDVEVTHIVDDPQPTAEEIDYLLAHARRYLNADLSASSILHAFAGLRPLIRASGAASTASLSREHVVDVDKFCLVSILGGKWTTYRRMAKDTIDAVARTGGLPRVSSRTEDLRLDAAT